MRYIYIATYIHMAGHGVADAAPGAGSMDHSGVRLRGGEQKTFADHMNYIMPNTLYTTAPIYTLSFRPSALL